MKHVLIEAEDGLIGPGSKYQLVTVFDSYEDAWDELMRRFDEFGGCGEYNEAFGNAYYDGSGGMMVWQIITTP